MEPKRRIMMENILKLMCVCLCLHQNLAAHQASCPIIPDLVLESPLIVGAWNAKVFGVAKMATPLIPEYMAKIVARYDIMAIQEVVDISGQSISNFLDVLNVEAYTQISGYDVNEPLPEPIPSFYSVTASPRVGNTNSSYREQYAVYYRNDRVSVVQEYAYSDPDQMLSYDPYVVVFDTPSLSIDEVAIVVVHTSPSRAVTEIDALVEVYEDVLANTGVQDVIIMGDFNAGCTYVTGGEWEQIRFKDDPRFTWLISDHIDTTSSSTTCPYDRIVLAGPTINDISYPGSAEAFHYDDFLSLTDSDTIDDISDHFPVEFQIQGKVISTFSLILSVGIDVQTSKNNIQALYEDCKDALANGGSSIGNCGATPDSVTGKKQDIAVTFVTSNQEETFEVLGNLEAQHHCIVNSEVRALLEHKLSNGVLRDGSLFLRDSGPQQRVTISCRNKICRVSVEAILDVV